MITGAADGLGRAAAETLLEQGHDVVVHARNDRRLAAVQDLRDGGAEAVVGDLSDLEETRGVAEQASRLGQMDAVIHNAGVLRGPQVLPVNTVAPYLLTALIVGFWTHDWVLATILFCAMVFNLIIAGVAGGLMPLALERLGFDPAIASSIFVTTFTDVGGFFSFLGLATVAMRTFGRP